MQRVSFLRLRALRPWLAAGCAVLVFSAGLRVASAADQAADDASGRASRTRAAETEGAATPQANDDERPSADPKLQLDDEGPALRHADAARRAQLRFRGNDEAEERPFWKSWVFWTVTGVLIAGAVGMIIYTGKDTGTGLAPCPANIQVSLGCFGAGR